MARRQTAEPANEPPSEAKAPAGRHDRLRGRQRHDRSHLREIAAAIGTSHRMLVYHFGSKEGLLVEVVSAVEAEQRQAVAALNDDARSTTSKRRAGEASHEPALRSSERLFFEIYAQALRVAARRPTSSSSSMCGCRRCATSASGSACPNTRQTRTRLMLAVARGLLLDLVGTGERRAVDRAMELFNRMTVAAHL
jgi:AcrR family transcriptional regulator